MLKKLTLIAIIAILAYSQAGYYIVLRHSQMLHKKAIKKQIRSQLSNADLEVISLTENYKKIHWLKAEKEFVFNGEMYDVVRRKLVDGNEIMYCIKDEKEKSLVDHYNLITKHNSSSDNKSKHSFYKAINLFVYEKGISIEIFYRLVCNKFPTFVSKTQEIYIEKMLPPPKGFMCV